MSSVIVVDDEPEYLNYMTRLIESFGHTVIKQCSNGTEVVSMAQKNCADLILMDVAMPQMDGLEACRAILKFRPFQKILIMTSFANDSWLHKALDAGAQGIITKAAPPASIKFGVDEVLNGRAFIEGRALNLLIDSARPSSTGDRAEFERRLALLDKTQMDIWRLICAGKSNREISKEVFLAESTVKAKISSIFKIMGVSSRTTLVRQAADFKALP